MPGSNERPLFFWRETEAEGGFLSPWYLSRFSGKGHTYESVGHYVMASKARVFNDEETLKKIHATTDANKYRALAAKSKASTRKFGSLSYRIAVHANQLKFAPGTASKGSGDIRDRLLDTGERELIDASPHDRVWGIGVKAADAKKKDARRDQWGENQFGKALMEARSLVRKDLFPTSVFDTPGSGYFVAW